MQRLLRWCRGLGRGGDDSAVHPAPIGCGKHSGQSTVPSGHRDVRAECLRELHTRKVKIHRNHVRALRARQLSHELTDKPKANDRNGVTQ